ncbi:Protein CBG19904 [Caenorhabditis briggsae]|uniref:Protein CBG19904 n=1 Tax=Caenorhabditis briggsae TaxID=6238 RepID=A8XWP9_CAEBR|nr:Protein CBG19904 [Caenorhabditis briggsae]CAP37068.1 Protein CBG19904 [Caenorhabditis briggsae]
MTFGTHQQQNPKLLKSLSDDAARLNAYWNYRDHTAPELREPGCIKRQPGRLGCDFKENGTEFKIAILGSSYAKNHHKMIIQECRHRASTISMADVTGCEPLAAPRKPVDNGKFSTDWTQECSSRLEEFVEFINETQPDYAFMMTRWFAVAEPYDNGPDNLNNDTIYLEMRDQLRKMLPNIKRKLFILDSFPRIHPEGIENIAREMKEGKKTMEEINMSLYEPKQFEWGRRRHAELVKNECGSKCELIDYVDAFWNQTMNTFQFFDSKGFLYFTTTLHVSAHGIEHVRPIYTKICAGATKTYSTGLTLAYVSNGYCSRFGPRTCYVAYSLMLHFLSHSLWSLLLSFSYRYYILFKPAPTRKTLVIILCVIYIPSLFQWVSFLWAQDDPEELREILHEAFPSYNLTGHTVTGTSNILCFSALYTILHMTIPITPVYICILILRRKIISRLSFQGVNITKDTKNLHSQLLMALAYQAVIPGFYLFSIASYAIGQFGIYNHPALEYFTFSSFLLIPFLSPLASFIFVTPYRKFIKHSFFKMANVEPGETSSTPQNYTSHIHVIG